MAQGLAQGLAHGLIQGLAESLLLILRVRGIALPDEMRAKIDTCKDPHLLKQWIRRAVTATTAEEVVAEAH